MRPTELIYNAWKNTKRPIIYETLDDKGNNKIVSCEFLAPYSHKYFKKEKGICPICGTEAKTGISSNKFFSANYTDWNIHKDPAGTMVCESCAFTMMLNSESGRMTLSRYSFCASKTLEIMNRGECRDRLLNLPEPPFVMAIAVSQKKHLAIKSKISYSKEYCLINLEEDTIPVNAEEIKKYIEIIEALRGIGFTKIEIERKKIRFDRIKMYGISAMTKIEDLYNRLSDLRLLKLSVFVAKKMKLEESECYLDLKPITTKQQQEHSSSMQYTKVEMSKEDQADMKCGDKSSDSREHPQNEQMTLELF